METKNKIKELCSLFVQERSDWFANSSAGRSPDRVVNKVSGNNLKPKTYNPRLPIGWSLKATGGQVKPNRGFTLLVAVLVSGVLLSIALAIFNITVKELLLSSSGRDSQFAFYAADSGAECALYWDQKGGGFSTSTPVSINCNGANIPDIGGIGYDNAMVFQFEVDGFCAIVSVTKAESHPRTKIESRGYNTTCDNTLNPRRIERAIRVTY